MINGKAYPSGEEINRARLEEYKAQFLDHEAPKGFRNCWEPGKNLFYDEACFKASIVVELRKARKEEKDDRKLGERAVDILDRKRPGAVHSPLVLGIQKWKILRLEDMGASR